MHYHHFAIVGCLGLLLTSCSRLSAVAGPIATATPASAAESAPVLNPDDDPGTIIVKVVKVYEKQKAISRCGYAKYKKTIHSTQVNGKKVLGEGIVEDWFQLPGYYKQVAHEVGGKGRFSVTVIADGKGWFKSFESEPVPVPWTILPQRPLIAFCNPELERLKDSDARLSKLGVVKLNGKDAIGIQATPGQTSFAAVFPLSVFLGPPPGHREKAEAQFYFDLQTGLLLKSLESSTESNHPLGIADYVRTRERVLADYKVVQGMPVPLQITEAIGKWDTTILSLIEVKFEQKFEPSVFSKP